jgi:hypothetical protein
MFKIVHSFVYSPHWISFPHPSSIACNGDWGIDTYPITPGHEIAGESLVLEAP